MITPEPTNVAGEPPTFVRRGDFIIITREWEQRSGQRIHEPTFVRVSAVAHLSTRSDGYETGIPGQTVILTLLSGYQASFDRLTPLQVAWIEAQLG